MAEKEKTKEEEIKELEEALAALKGDDEEEPEKKKKKYKKTAKDAVIIAMLKGKLKGKGDEVHRKDS